MNRFVDLSQEIYTKQPVYHTHADTVIWTDTSHEDTEHLFREQLDGDDPPFTFESSVIQMCDHGPTHVDAIRHLKPGGTPIDEMALDSFYGPGKAIDVSHREPGEYITVADLDAACEDQGITVQEGDVLLIRTGHYDETYPTRSYVENYPGLNEEATRWLVEKGVKNFGVDQPSPDTPEDITYPCHTLCKEHELPHIENLRNIDRVLGETFTYIGFPLNIRDGTGSPIRAIAQLEN